MAKSQKRIEARKMRSNGESVRVITKKLGVSKSSVSLWVRDIILTVEHMESLKQRRIKGAELGRLRGSLAQKNKRLNTIREMEKKGIKKFKNITDQEFFSAGIALYWEEGSKKTRKLGICNSDPEMIKFMISWYSKFFNLGPKRLSLRVGINQSHEKRETIVRKYWSDITGVPMSNFRKTSFKRVVNAKIYENHDNHFGTLDVVILKPGDLYYKMLGLIKGLSLSRQQ
ncbi:hypothetical protein ISR94_02215 [Candidatus Microgenomates bacterium]|nr:hypothetical protein [Candidatus Microgenomates bacterium]